MVLGLDTPHGCIYNEFSIKITISSDPEHFEWPSHNVVNTIIHYGWESCFLRRHHRINQILSGIYVMTEQ